MINKVIIFSLFLLFSSSAISKPFGDVLARNKVNHFQLLVNNLNMMFMAAMFMEKENTEKPKNKINQEFVRFSGSKDNRLIIDYHYSAPVSEVKRSKCVEILQSDIDKMNSPNNGIAKMLSMFSFYKISLSDAEEIIGSARINIHVIANENTELRISCSN